jgi:WD40 repeat protein
MITVWDAENGVVLLGPLKGHSGPVRSVAFSKDGRYIVSGGEDNTILVWDAETGAVVVGPLEGHTGVVNSVAFSQDSELIVSGSTDQTVRVWNAQQGNIVAKQQCIENRICDHNVILRDGDSIRHAFGDGSRLENGWIINSPSMLIFWVPPWYRVGLWRPRNTAIIGQASVKLDFSRFVHGTSWEQCKKAD